MAYGSNYYNYQVAVIFAILVAALLLLGAVVYLLYQAANKGIRKPKYGPPQSVRTRTPSSSLPHTRTQWQPAPQPIQPTAYPVQDYDPRMDSRLAQQPQPGYSQQPLVYPQNTYETAAKVRELQPEYVYQQGPVSWTSQQPIHEAAYPVSPVQQIQASASTSGYHMSSV